MAKKPKAKKADGELLQSEAGAEATAFIDSYADKSRNNSRVYIWAILKHVSMTPGIFNADMTGAQKTGVNPAEELAAVISSECVGASLWRGRGGYDAPKITTLPELLRFFTYNRERRTALRGGAPMTDQLPGGTTKALALQMLYSRNPNNTKVHVNDRLGIQSGDKGKNAKGDVKNDAPRQQILYAGTEFVFQAVIHGDVFTPYSCRILRAVAKNIIPALPEVDQAAAVAALKAHIEAEYPLDKDGRIDLDHPRKEVEARLLEYRHQVHRRYNPVFAIEGLSSRTTNTLAEEIETLAQIKSLYEA